MSGIIKKDNNNQGRLGKLKGINDLAPKISGKLDLPRTFYQKVIFLLDASGSMTWEGKSGKSKGEEVSFAVDSVIQRLKQSKNKNCFDISIYTYSAPIEYKKIIDNQLVTNIKTTNFNPTFYQEPKGTYLYSALYEAIKEGENYYLQNRDKNAQVLIIILSDGGIVDYKKCFSISRNISSEMLEISTIYFEDANIDNLESFNIKVFGEDFVEEHKRILKTIASKPNLFHISINSEEIRKHMIKSISTVSKID